MYCVLSTDYNSGYCCALAQLIESVLVHGNRVMAIRFAASLLAIAVIACLRPAAAQEQLATAKALRAAIEKSLPLLMTGAVGHRENRTCFACHQQGPPIMALTAARQRGFAIDEE